MIRSNKKNGEAKSANKRRQTQRNAKRNDAGKRRLAIVIQVGVALSLVLWQLLSASTLRQFAESRIVPTPADLRGAPLDAREGDFLDGAQTEEQ